VTRYESERGDFTATPASLKRSILTEKVARRGFHVTREYAVDPLEAIFVREVMETDLHTVEPGQRRAGIYRALPEGFAQRRQRLFRVLGPGGRLAGVLPWSAVLAARADGRPEVRDAMITAPTVAHPDEILRDVADRMAATGTGALPVVDRSDPALPGAALPGAALAGPAGPGYQVVERPGQLAQLGQVRLGQLGDEPVSGLGELHPDHPRVLDVGAAPDEPGHRGAVDQLDRAVVAQQQVVGEVADGRRGVTGMPFDGDQQLMLDVGQADRLGLFLAPVLEPAQVHPEREEVLEVLAIGLRQIDHPAQGLHVQRSPEAYLRRP
jgi:CBS domain-containing protein